MSEAKQIEEMARVLCGMASGCNKCMFNGETCYEHKEAEELYNAGYRKQSEPISCGHEKGDGLILTFDGATGYFPREFIIEAIKTHMKQSEGEWISVRERLPERGESVLVYSSKYGPIVECRDLVTYMRMGNYSGVTHWMPLPEPPDMKGGAE